MCRHAFEAPVSGHDIAVPIFGTDVQWPFLPQNFARVCRPRLRLIGFAFKGVSQLFVDRQLELQALLYAADEMTRQMRVLNDKGELAMLATSQFSPV